MATTNPTRAELDAYIASGAPRLSLERQCEIAHADLRAWFEANIGLGTLGEIHHENFWSAQKGPENWPDHVWARVEDLPLHPKQAILVVRHGSIHDDDDFIVTAEVLTADGDVFTSRSDSTVTRQYLESLAEIGRHLL